MAKKIKKRQLEGVFGLGFEYAQILIRQLEFRRDRIDKIIESANEPDSELSENDVDCLDAKRRGFAEAISLAKTIYTKMSRGSL